VHKKKAGGRQEEDARRMCDIFTQRLISLLHRDTSIPCKQKRILLRHAKKNTENWIQPSLAAIVERNHGFCRGPPV